MVSLLVYNFANEKCDCMALQKPVMFTQKFNFILLTQLVAALKRHPCTMYHVVKLKRSALLEGAFVTL